MNLRVSSILLAAALVAACGCGRSSEESRAPSEGTVVRQNMTPEERIRKIQEDPNIPPEYKQTYINSVMAESQAKGNAPR